MAFSFDAAGHEDFISSSESSAPGLYSRSGTSQAADASGRPLLDFHGASATALREVLGQTDEITCAVFHARVAMVGTRLGCLYRVDPSVAEACRILARGIRLIEVSLESEGRWCAAACSDGRAVVVDVFASASDTGAANEPWFLEHSPPSIAVLSVGLCPKCLSPGYDGFFVCTGGQDGRLVLHRRARLGGQKLVHDGEGPISCIRWQGDLVAWANDRGLKVVNARTGQRVTYVPRPAEVEGASASCSITWGSEDRLYVAWGRATTSGCLSIVKIVFFVESESGGGLCGEVRNQFSSAELICGVSSAGPHHLCFFSVNSLSSRATVSLCGYNGGVFHSAEVPGLRTVSHGQMRLSSVAPHLPMLISTPRDLIILQIRDFLEHSVQLLEFGLFDEAIRLANGGGDGVEGLRNLVCVKCVLPDLKANRFEQACLTVGKFRDLEPPTWQELAVLFDRFGGLQYLAVSDALPVPPRGTRLPTDVYDEVLQRLVSYPSALVVVLQLWTPDMFSTNAFRERLCALLPDLATIDADAMDEEARYRIEALARFEAIAGDVVLAIRLMLELRNPDVFDLFRRALVNERKLPSPGRGTSDNGHDEHIGKGTPVAELAGSSVRRLFDMDEREACSLLVDRRAVIPVDIVVKSLVGCDNRWRHHYLKHLFSLDEVAGQDYHMQMVRLFAEYEPTGLLPFLKASERYEVDAALGVCEQRGLLEEQAYLLGREGRVTEAMNIYLEKMVDVKRAVHFAAANGDPELWDVLIKYCFAHPSLLVPLLEHLDELGTGDEVGKDNCMPHRPDVAMPENVLRNLPPGTPVPRIASTIRRVVDSFELSASLYVSCNTLSAQETLKGKQMCVKAEQRALSVSPDVRKCIYCGRLLSAGPPEYANAGLGSDMYGEAGFFRPHICAQTAKSPLLPIPRGASPRRFPASGVRGILLNRRGAMHKRCLADRATSMLDSTERPRVLANGKNEVDFATASPRASDTFH